MAVSGKKQSRRPEPEEPQGLDPEVETIFARIQSQVLAIRALQDVFGRDVLEALRDALDGISLTEGGLPPALLELRGTVWCLCPHPKVNAAESAAGPPSNRLQGERPSAVMPTIRDLEQRIANIEKVSREEEEDIRCIRALRSDLNTTVSTIEAISRVNRSGTEELIAFLGRVHEWCKRVGRDSEQAQLVLKLVKDGDLLEARHRMER